MLRVKLLEALYLQGKEMRQLSILCESFYDQRGYFILPEYKEALGKLKLAEAEYDRMTRELAEWYTSAETADRPLSDPTEVGAELEDNYCQCGHGHRSFIAIDDQTLGCNICGKPL